MPWLVSVLAVATSSSLSAAARRRSSHAGGTTVSELTITTSAGAVSRKAAFMLRTKPRFCSRRTYSTPSNPRATASISGSGDASSATTIRVPGVVLATTLRRHSSNSSRAP